MAIWIKVDEGHHIDFLKVVAVRVDHMASGDKGFGMAKVVSPSGEFSEVAITEAHPYKEAVGLVDAAMATLHSKVPN